MHDELKDACRRCGAEAVVVVRSQPLCTDDFVKYIQTKITKKLEAFRVRHAPSGFQRKILLPLSLGASSLTLLHILDQQTKRQIERTGRTGYSLTVLGVLPEDTGRSAAFRDHFDRVKARYPAHDFELVTLDAARDCAGSLPRGKSATSNADVQHISMTRTIVDAALARGCHVVCWGHSTTRLAEKVVSETAKGRGFAIAWLLNDGDTPYGVDFAYPVRDLLKKELISFCDIVSPPLRDLVLESDRKSSSVSSKNTSIDGLVTEYFASVEQNFPNIVTNVVRTTGRLHAPEPDSSTRVCDSCTLPLQHGHASLQAWSGQQNTVASTEDDDEPQKANLCYACSRALTD